MCGLLCVSRVQTVHTERESDRRDGEMMKRRRRRRDVAGVVLCVLINAN